jgi:hypothetical protein
MITIDPQHHGYCESQRRNCDYMKETGMIETTSFSDYRNEMDFLPWLSKPMLCYFIVVFFLWDFSKWFKEE